MPVNVGGIILAAIGFVILYFTGMMVLSAALANSKSLGKSVFLTAAVVTYTVAPFAYYGYDRAESRAATKKRNEEVANGRALNIRAFSDFCKDRKRTIFKRPKDEDEVVLSIRIEPDFKGQRTDFNAGQIGQYMQTRGRFAWKQPDICASSMLRYLEGEYRRKYVAELKGYLPEYRRYALCEKRGWDVQNNISSQYELVLGEFSTTASAPWLQEQTWLAHSSARIRDRRSGEVLAEDTMYFLRYDSGVGNCPYGLDQLSELITDVFSER